jgi:hypothetical protein
MTRLRRGLAVAAMAMIMGSLAAGCGGSGPVSGAVKSAISSLSPSRTASISLPTARPPTPTAEAPPASQAPETAPAPPPAAASTAAASGSSSSLLWLWIALAALVVIGLIVWIARASGRRSAAAAGWRSAVIDTYAKGQALADAVRIADRPGPPAAGAGWAGLQARADELSRELYRLREGARDEEDRMRVDDTLTSLRGLRSAMADEQAAGGAGGPGSPEAAQVRGRLMSFEESLRALRAPYEQMPRI